MSSLCRRSGLAPDLKVVTVSAAYTVVCAAAISGPVALQIKLAIPSVVGSCFQAFSSCMDLPLSQCLKQTRNHCSRLGLRASVFADCVDTLYHGLA